MARLWLGWWLVVAGGAGGSLQIGEALDASVFDPEAVRRPLPLANRAKFNFMTNGKWEQRKGWDVLLRAYYAEFAAKGVSTDVALHFVARMNDEAREQFRAFQHNISREVRNPSPPARHVPCHIRQRMRPVVS